MSHRIAIIGTNSLARECYWTLKATMENDSSINFQGFLSFEGFVGDLKELAHLHIGSDDDYSPTPGDRLVIGIANPKIRLRLYDKWKKRKASFFNIIHPETIVNGPVDFGEGNILKGYSAVSCNTHLGEGNLYNGVVIAHDVTIGRSNMFGVGVKLLGGVKVGSCNSFGVDSVALPGARIGDNNTIAPGAVIYKGCRNNCVMAGNPALPL